VIAGLTHLHRLGHAGFVFAREGVFGLVDPTRLPLPARAALRVARLIERPASSVSAPSVAERKTTTDHTFAKPSRTGVGEPGHRVARRSPHVDGVSAGNADRSACT
jgi:hypothetical protein